MLPVVTGENGNNKVPDYYLLKQNYPNPFNPLTTIGFDIPQAGLVNLQIFNVLGEYVTELFNEYLTAGTHEVEWNAASFSSGLYFYKITVNRFTEIKKMVLIK
ncbi:MAG TPA: T9SS type A sorting domain-containing protein [Ignavibacteria bacterium]|nr:T9SS type A sorting domain-containing protein [Ignavibacteria bacterium]